MAPRKKRPAASGRKSPARAPTKKAVTQTPKKKPLKLWTAPTPVARSGPSSVKPSRALTVTTTGAATKRDKQATEPARAPRKLWTPPGVPNADGKAISPWDIGVDGIQYSKVTDELYKGMPIRCIWYGHPKLGGLAVTGVPGHSTRLIAFLRGVATDYKPSSGYCFDHDSDTLRGTGPEWLIDSEPCEGARWVLAHLQARAKMGDDLDAALDAYNARQTTLPRPELSAGALEAIQREREKRGTKT